MSAPSIWQLKRGWDGFPSLSARAACEVAVIGAGVTGASCAWRLREHGRDVVLLDAREAAAGASGRNGGFATAGTALGPERAERLLGEPAAAALLRLTQDARERMLERAAEIGAGAAVRRTGSLALATAAEAPTLDERMRLLRRAGVECEPAPVPPPLRRRFAAAALTPGDATLQPAAWVRALVAACARRGARVHERSPALALRPSDGGWLVRTGAALLEAAAVVVCCDGLTARVLPELRELVYPVRGQVLATAPLERPALERPVSGDDGHLYALPTPDGRIVLGGRRPVDRGREYADEEAVNGAVQRALDAVLEDDLGVDPRAVERRWAGIMGFSPDLLPLVGPVPARPGVHVSAGYSGSGNVQGFLCGEIAADLVCGHERPEAAPLRAARFWRDGRPLAGLPRLELEHGPDAV